MRRVLDLESHIAVITYPQKDKSGNFEEWPGSIKLFDTFEGELMIISWRQAMRIMNEMMAHKDE